MVDVVIVGGGFSGAVLAVQLLRRNPTVTVVIVDPASQPGRGLAYSTPYACHLLNVRAGNMSAFPDEPHHFVRWARANYSAEVQEPDYLPRSVYGDYVGALLEEATASSGGQCIHWTRDEVAAIRDVNTHLKVRLSSGLELSARTVVLATGNHTPADLGVPGLSPRSKYYVPSPWSGGTLKEIPSAGSVLLVGAGLTSVDVALALRDEGFTGSIHVVSRHGFFPQVHRQTAPWPLSWDTRCPLTTLGLFRRIRNQAQAAAASGSNWRAVIDALRPSIQTIWHSLPVKEKKRFLRHVRSVWDVHRHRIAPAAGSRIDALIGAGRIILHAGRLTAFHEGPARALVQFRDRATATQRILGVDRVINCTGPESDFRRISAPLIADLLEQGMARPDALALGFDVDQHGTLLDCEGVPSAHLYAIGPPRKGQLWECTAVPEIRVQAAQLADRLVALLERDAPSEEIGGNESIAAPSRPTRNLSLLDLP
jgi:uncharacterized NAD(P)/FAD-binding protein YdhS